MHGFENHKQWSDVKDVCSKLRAKGFKALLAGGCVRDLIMNRTPNDFDIATDATPDQVAQIFPKALLVGRQFGVTILPYPEYQLEVATFRVDLEYKDGRRPEGVKFSTPEEDAKRRDFTANALFYDLETDAIIDYVGGREDIAKGVLRTVGEPERRFEEDKLRLLRAVRFAAQLDFKIAPETLKVVKEKAHEVSVVSRERVRDELTKLLKTSSRETGLRLLVETGLHSVLFPEVKADSDWIARFLKAPNEDAELSLALFYFPLRDRDPKSLRKLIVDELKLENATTDLLIHSYRLMKVFSDSGNVRKGQLLLELTHPAAKLAIRLLEINSESTSALIKLANESLGASWAKPLPLITGDDAKALGLTPGKQMGEVLSEAFLLQLEGKFQSKADALNWLKTKA